MRYFCRVVRIVCFGCRITIGGSCRKDNSIIGLSEDSKGTHCRSAQVQTFNPNTYEETFIFFIACFSRYGGFAAGDRSASE